MNSQLFRLHLLMAGQRHLDLLNCNRSQWHLFSLIQTYTLKFGQALVPSNATP